MRAITTSKYPVKGLAFNNGSEVHHAGCLLGAGFALI